MPAQKNSQYTIRGIPPDLDLALRRMAQERELSLNQLIVDELAGVARHSAPRKYRSTEGIAGHWVDDAEFEQILKDQRQIDEALWR